MNALNLRISSVKTGENIRKNAEMRTSLVILPEEYKIASGLHGIDEFLNAKTIQEQVDVVKNLFPRQESLEFISDLYFIAPLKHPVRNQISRLFIKEHGDCNAEILDIFSKSLRKFIKLHNLPSSDSLNTLITSISSCFDNFPLGLKALSNNMEVFPILADSLEVYSSKLKSSPSPSQKNEIYLYIHSSIRVALSFIQELSDVLVVEHKSTLQKLETSVTLIGNPDIPMDTKTNCGILLCYISKLFGTYENFLSKAQSSNLPEEIALSAGIINTIQESDFTKHNSEFLKVIEKVVQIGLESCSIPNILLASARIVYNFSKSLLNYKTFTENESVSNEMVLKMNSYALAFFEHHMDSVRHLCKDIFKNVVVLAKRLNNFILLENIFKSCRDEFALSISAVVLLQVSSALGTQYVLDNMSCLFERYFDNHLGNDLHINNFFEGLMLSHHKEVDIQIWQNLWVAYLLDSTKFTGARLAEIENLISKAVKCEPQVLQFICEYKLSKISISTKLAALSSAKKSLKQVNIEPFTGDFREAILSSSDDTKILALKLLIESRKTTEMFTEFELDYIKLFVTYNANCQSPATRQSSLALLLKALVRLSLNIDKVRKSKDVQIENNYHFTFLKDLVLILSENLKNGANFSRRSISLHLLEKCVEIIKNLKLPTSLLPMDILEKLLFERLDDSYESNKQFAVRILLSLHELGVIQTTSNLEDIRQLIVSVKPTDSLTAAYQLEYLCETSKDGSYGSSYYNTLTWVKDILLEGLVIAKKSILIASRDNPLYGSLVVIKHLLSKLDFKKLEEEHWRNFMFEIVGLAKELTKVVGPVVNNSSPEGHLPNDFSPLHNEGDFNDGDNKVLASKRQKTHNLKITPQMVLICAWRTVKEVSLILGDIVLYSPLNVLVTKQQVIEIGEHFKELLSETKHRGAFEQAYVGFSKLCTRLWREPELHQLPMIWLTDLMEVISKDDNTNAKMCATRRSAGVPFLVQALIISELQVGTTKALNYCMSTLISICYDPLKSTDSRVHALNILRALFRSTDLNEVVGSFVTDGMICSIKGYDANTWAERNSSTLLFASLITRVFGVQKTKDAENLNIRNKMTGRIFFLRYPRLYDFILNQLEEASKGVYEENFEGKGRSSTRKLHPLLLLLSRLYPSALEGTESNLKLSDFIPLISICSSCKELQTRILAAKAITAIISKDQIDDYLTSICSLLSSEVKWPQNFVHGQVLQILHILKCNTFSKTIGEFIVDSLSNVQLKTENIVVLTTVFDIYNVIFKKIEVIDVDLNKIQCNYSQKNSFYYPVFRKSLLLFQLYKYRLQCKSRELSELLHSFENSTYEEVETKLNILLLKKLETFDENFEFRKDEQDFSDSLRLDSYIDAGKLLDNVISTKVFYPECTIKAYAIYSSLDSELKFSLDELINLSAKQVQGHSKTPLAMCVEKLTGTKTLGYEDLGKCLEYLKAIAQPWNPDFLRFKASSILGNICGNLSTALKREDVRNSVDTIQLMFDMLQDDDLDVRNKTSDVVLKATGSTDSDVLPLYAAELLTDWLINQLKALKLSQGFVENLFLEIKCLNTHVENSERNGTDDLEIFDKNEANVFAEPHVILGIVTKAFSNSFEFV